VSGFDHFAAKPTTSLAVVSEIVHNFADLSARLGIENPTLAHHDAGAIGYERTTGQKFLFLADF